ncbi:MAG TPA: hypothetical protein PL033_19425 [Candidatus Brocadiia bacterium]|nr:hypothetical protein [Candidatus Brocadiia bacterium]
MTKQSFNWLTPEIEDAQFRHMARVADLYRGRAPEHVIAIDGRWFGRSHGLAGINETDMLEEPEKWLREILADMAQNAACAADSVTFRPLVIELDPLGVHFIDALFGAKTSFRDGQVWAERLDCAPRDLAMPDLSGSEVLRRGLRLAQIVCEAVRPPILVATPVFSCPVNIAINLFGDRILDLMMDDPSGAHRCLRIINDAIAGATRAFMEVMPEGLRRNSVAENRYAPPGFGQIDGCATDLFSAAQYAEFFAPLDSELLDLSPRGGMMHLCGDHARHIPELRSMKTLRSAQLNDRASDDFERFWKGLREDQIVYVGPKDGMGIERILDISRGRRVILQCSIEKPVPVR